MGAGQSVIFGIPPILFFGLGIAVFVGMLVPSLSQAFAGITIGLVMSSLGIWLGAKYGFIRIGGLWFVLFVVLAILAGNRK